MCQDVAVEMVFPSKTLVAQMAIPPLIRKVDLFVAPVNDRNNDNIDIIDIKNIGSLLKIHGA